MRLLKLCILWLIWILTYQFAWAASYNYPYVCPGDYSHACFITQTWEININDSWHFMSNTDIRTIPDFQAFMNIQTNIISNYYGETTFTIPWYYTWTGELVNKELDLHELINIETSFNTAEEWDDEELVILQTYESWRDYLYTHYTDIIDELHIQWFPEWVEKNRLRDILPNLIWYDHSNQSFRVRNVCPDNLCYSSSVALINYTSNNTLILLNGDIRHKSQFVLDVFRVSEEYTLSSLMLIAWEDVSFDFWFEDYLDVWSEETSYSYTISYAYDGWDPQELFTEIISVDQDYNISSDTITPEILEQMIEIEVLSDVFKQIRIWIREGVQLTQFWNVTFFLSAENLNTWDVFPTTSINPNVPVQVIPSNTLWSAEWNIQWFSNETNNAWYNIWDTISVIMYVYDEFANRHYDYIEGYDISLAEGSSSAIELAKQWSDDYSDTITWVTSSEFSPYTVSFRFRIMESWFHPLEGFTVRARYKNSNSSYSDPAQYSEETMIPTNLFHDGQKLNIHIRSPLETDFDITCTNQPITLEAVCTSDNFSWCNPEMNQSVTFTSEEDNGTIWTLEIRDYAHNVRNFNYVMNHIDQTAPRITISRWLNEITSDSYSYKANSDPLNINFFEATTSNCEAEIHYTIYINGEMEVESTHIGSNYDVDISDFFTQSWDTELKIEVSDKYQNTSTKIMNFTIHPDVLDSTQTTISSHEYDTKYANAQEFYNYTLTLRDQFSNPISWKTISNLSHDCTNYTWCSRIINNVNWNTETWQSSLIISNISWVSNDDWEITFQLLSRAPWVFTNVFWFDLQDWDDEYQNIWPVIRRYVSSDDTNSFNRLFVWALEVSDDEGDTWWALPSYGTELDYRLVITSPFWVSSMSTNVSNFSESIRAYDSELSFVEWVSAISWLNTKTPSFQARINTSDTADQLWTPWLQLSNQSNQTDVLINYNIQSNLITTYLSQNDSAADRTPISVINDTDDIFLWVEIIWLLQWLWNTVITWQEANISNISTSDARNQIRRNAVTQTRWMQNWDVINGVRYVTGDVSLSWQISWYETLVVQNGNITINWNLNTNQENLWIIVLSDNYNVDSGYQDTWNVYVTPNVTEIYGAIYADGALVSVDSSWNPYPWDSSARNNELRNQLYLKGSLFTRNTIWWGILSDWVYTLPWGRTIQANNENFRIALSYDLNYIRRWRDNCLESSPWVCKFPNWAFIIENDPSFRVNPPRLF